jgi:oxygen-independent coproporphyrinogen III oxidase
MPLALYVHIPFCVRKCYYCDFNSGPAPDGIREQYVEALVSEIRTSPWRGQEARTVFFGGGTPSELNTGQLSTIAAALRETFEFNHQSSVAGGQSSEVRGQRSVVSGQSSVPAQVPAAPTPNTQHPTPHTQHPEWTIECNPKTVSMETMAGMREMGFNRISLGVQSFHDHHLKAIGRIHSSGEAVEAVALARRAGFRRLNLDLIFCLPGQTLDEWKRDVETALSLGPEHLSLYNLTIEEKTEFGRRHRQGLLALPDEDLSADMYEWVIDRMVEAGFQQYEISNFALPGEECRHNQVYWRDEPFVGLGLSAASFMNGLRWTNTGSMQRYLATSGREGGPERASEERLPPQGACGEAIMLGLRTRDGVDLPVVAARHGLDSEQTYGKIVRELLADGLLARDGARLTLTRRGVMLANAVCARFL